MSPKIRGCRRNGGFSLIEVLVALLVIAIGVLGAVALQTRAVEAGMEAYQRTQALLLVEDMLNRMANNKSYISACYGQVGSGVPGYLGTGAPSASTGCNALADADLAQWHELLLGAGELTSDEADAKKVGGILGARGCIKALPASGEYRVSVAWQGLSRLSAETGKDSCAQGAYESESYRRVVGITLRVSDLR